MNVHGGSSVRATTTRLCGCCPGGYSRRKSESGGRAERDASADAPDCPADRGPHRPAKIQEPPLDETGRRSHEFILSFGNQKRVCQDDTHWGEGGEYSSEREKQGWPLV